MTTLANYKNTIFTKPQNFGDVTVASLMNRMGSFDAYLKNIGHKKVVSPEVDAITFYLGQTLMGYLSQNFDVDQQLPEPVEELVADYYEKLSPLGLRMFYYLLLINSRETRHAKNWKSFASQLAEFGALDFYKTVAGMSDGMDLVKKMGYSAPSCSVVSYAHHMFFIFDNCTFGGGYGGKPWANIAKTFYAFVKGDTTMEMMVDTGYTLAHNNGPIFNKGMYYSGYEQNELIKILDCQRAGLIPELVAAHATHFVNSTHLEYLDKIRAVFPTFCGSTVDWQKVEDLGAVGDYEHLIKKQKANYVPKPKTGSTTFKATKSYTIKSGPAEQVSGTTIVITPNLTVKKVNRKGELV